MTTLREEIDIIIGMSKSNGDSIKAEAVVEMAKNAEKFPALHKHLWEVPEEQLAAEARLQRAHKLLISIRVVTSDGHVTRMMVHTNSIEGYRPLTDVIASRDLAAEKLKQFSDDIGRARTRLHAFRSALNEDLVSELDDLLAKAQTKAEAAANARGAKAA